MKNYTDNSRTGRRPTVAVRRDMVERFRRSGQTRREFCESEGVAKSTLDWWLRKSAAGCGKGAAFQEVAVMPAERDVTSNWAMEIVSPQGWTIRSRQTLSVSEMAQLLQEPPC